MDKMKTVFAKNRLTNLVTAVPEDHANHPVLGANLEVVRSGKQRVRLSEIVQDAKSSATRVTNVAAPDKDKED